MSNKPTNKTKTRERTSKQWAWEFLRRNPNYRDAFNVMSRLTCEQCSFLQALISGQVFEFDEHLNVLETLPTNIFDTKKLKGVETIHRTLLDYLNGIGAYSQEFKSEWGGVAERVQLVVLEKYRLETYAIENWIDPRCVELTDADEKSFGRLNPKIEHALVHLKVDGAQSKPKPDFFREMPPEQFLKIGKNEERFFNMGFAKKWQAALQKISGDATFAKPDPTQFESDALANVTFDLSLPIKGQIDAVAAKLMGHQRVLQDAGLIDTLPSRSNRDNIFSVYITILDLHENGMSDLDVAIKIKSLSKESYRDAQGKLLTNYVDSHAPDKSTAQEHTASVRKQLERARHLRDYGYRSLALQKD